MDDGKLVPVVPSALHEGKDEMNFAEFPLGVISKRSDPAVKTLVFVDKITDRRTGEVVNRKLTITGADAYGLPTSTDDEVLLALIQITKLQGFTDRKVYFSRYQLIRLLGWPVNGQSYQRIKQALDRWLGITLNYENAWREQSTKSWQNEGFHVLERVKTDAGETAATRPKPDPGQAAFEFASSFFVWNEVVFKSFVTGNIKGLDFAFLMSLESAISRRLYRFLDKRFHKLNRLEFDLNTLAFEKIAMSRNTPTGDLKRQINSAIDELVSTGFLKALPKDERFRKEKAGEWHVIFERAGSTERIQSKSSQVDLTLDDELSPTELALIEAGVKRDKAQDLASRFPVEKVQEKLEVLSYLLERKSSQVERNPAGFLIRSIEEDYAAPRGFVTSAQRKKRLDVEKRNREQQTLATRNQEETIRARNAEIEALYDSYWASLSP